MTNTVKKVLNRVKEGIKEDSSLHIWTLMISSKTFSEAEEVEEVVVEAVSNSTSTSVATVVEEEVISNSVTSAVLEISSTWEEDLVADKVMAINKDNKEEIGSNKKKQNHCLRIQKMYCHFHLVLLALSYAGKLPGWLYSTTLEIRTPRR